MGRSPCCDKLGLKKGPWTPEEDQKLLAYIEEHGHGNWRALPTKAGLQRCGKSCRLRWTNYLRPDIKRGKFSLQEEQTIIQLHALLGNRWSAIATHLPKRTDNEIKNYWNTHLKKRLTKMGIDPVTHKPKNDALVSSDGGGQQSKNAATLSHIAQWESARLEAEARLARQSKLGSKNNNNSSNNSSSFASLSPDLHINSDDYHIVPTVSSSLANHQYLSTTNAETTTSTTTRCLDVLKAWHSVWPSSTTNNNNERMINIEMNITGGGGGVGIESPTSTLSFSENAPPAVVSTLETTGAGAVIEFMGKQGNDEWKRDYFHHDHGESFMEGFTELLLSTTTTNTTDDHNCKTTVNASVEKSGAKSGGDDNDNNDANSSGSTSRSGGSDYYEDNKTYWNSILNLVNSSPPHSPMF